jgi:glycosyltransferase involved in cell wall biosynthesis
MRLHLRVLAEALAERHEVCVVALRWPEQHGEIAGVELVTIDAPVSRRTSEVRDRAVAVVRRRPVDWKRLADPFASVLPRLLAQRSFDIVHVALDDVSGIAPLLAGLPSVIAPLDARHLNIEAQNLHARGVERVWRAQQGRAVRRALATSLRSFGAAVFVTREDADAVGRLDPSLRTVVIPIAVDATVFARPVSEPPRDPALIVFTGVLSSDVNVEAAERLVDRIFPLVRASVPAAQVVLAGRMPSASVRQLATHAGVTVVANPLDLRPWLWRATAFACPMSQGTGMKNKLLEAMAAGVAVVATPLACRGLDARHDEHVLIADTDEAIAADLVRILGDHELRDRLGHAAHRYVVDHHSPRTMSDRFVALYADVAGSAGSD